MEALSPAAIDGLRADIAGISVADDAATLKLKSRDFYWFSPILKAALDDKRAELVVSPRTKDEVKRVAAACVRHRVPLTVRGGGTGNYGQAVPLSGGVLLDISGLDRVVSIMDFAPTFCAALDVAADGFDGTPIAEIAEPTRARLAVEAAA